MKGVQCYELFGGIALKNHAFFSYTDVHDITWSGSSQHLQTQQNQHPTAKTSIHAPRSKVVRPH